MTDEPILKLIEFRLSFEQFSNLGANVGSVYHDRRFYTNKNPL